MSFGPSKIGSYGCDENFYGIKQDPTKILSKDPVLEIFSYLNLATLGTICRVSRRWLQLVNANDSILWKNAIYREIAFGNDKWAQCCGTDVVKGEDNIEEFSSLPLRDFIEDCRKFKRKFPAKRVQDSLMLLRFPKTLNGQLTLKSLGELAKKYFSESVAGYGGIWPNILAELGDRPIDQSRWVVMTKDVLPGSRSKSYSEQQAIVAELAANTLISFEVPGVLESAACILSQFFLDSKTRLFGDNPWTYTRCPEQFQGYQIIVGGFAPAGLHVNYCDDSGNELHWRCGPTEVLRSLALGPLAFGKGSCFLVLGYDFGSKKTKAIQYG